MPKLKTGADVERAKKHALRPHLSPTELLAEHARHERDRAAERAADVLRRADTEARSAHPSEAVEVRDLLADHEKWSGRYEGFTKQITEQRERLSIRREPLTYEPPERGGKQSFFADHYQARYLSSRDAQERIERHRAEMDVEMPRLRRRLESEQRSKLEALGEVEYRVNPATVQGFGGYFTPPAWINEAWATAPRPERVLSRHFTTFSIPAAPGFSSINLPKIATGATENVESDAAATADADIADSSSTANLVTIAGQQDVAIQLLEQSPRTAHLDMVVWKELAAAYDATFESQVWNGGGGSYELDGVLNATGIGAVTTSEAIGVKTFPALGETFGTVSDKRKLSATAFYMRGGRWASLATAEDEQHRPLYVPLDVQTSRTANPIGVLLGLPVYLTESVPVNLGASKNQDCMLAGRSEDSYLWESAPTLHLFDESLSSTLEVRILLRAYSGLIHRYPTSYCSLTGWKVEPNL